MPRLAICKAAKVDGMFLCIVDYKRTPTVRCDVPTQMSSIVAGSSFVFSNVAYMNYDVIEIEEVHNDPLVPSTIHASTHPLEHP